MTCRELERRLEAWLAGELPPAERSAWESHLATCDACRELVELAGWADESEASEVGEPPADLVLGVLERTSGTACARVREDLMPLVDGELPGERRELVELHLASCPDCRDLHGILDGLPADLTLLADVDPGPGFVDEVLARTVRADRSAVRHGVRHVSDRSPAARLRRWWATTWPALVHRPRFAWEAAYVLALILMPLVAWADLPERAADLVGRAGRAGAVKVAAAAQGLAEGAGGVAERAGTLGASADAELRTFHRRLASTLERGREDGPNDPDDSNPPKGDTE